MSNFTMADLRSVDHRSREELDKEFDKALESLPKDNERLWHMHEELKKDLARYGFDEIEEVYFDEEDRLRFHRLVFDRWFLGYPEWVKWFIWHVLRWKKFD